MIIQLDSSVLEENHITFFFFSNESFLEIETNIWHTPCIRKSNFTSRAVLVFSLLLFFFLYFPILFFSENWLLPKTRLLHFFRFSSFFRNWFHTMSSVFIVATSQKTDDPCELNVWSLTMEIKIMKNGFSLFWALKQNCFFFPITKRIEKARCSSKSFTESLTRSSSIWYQAMTKILVNT